MQNWATKKRLFVYDWQGPDALKSFAPLARQPYSLFLDSSRKTHPLSRYSYLLWHPFETIEMVRGRVTITNRENSFTYEADPFQVVRERLALWGEGLKSRDDLPPFQGGAVGYFGYDLSRRIENLPSKAKKNDQPDLCIGLYDKVLVFDHQTGKAYLIIHVENEDAAKIQKYYIESIIESHEEKDFSVPELTWNTERDDNRFKKDIQRVIDYIYAGDIFQANLSRRFTANLPKNFDEFSHYTYLRNINAAPYGAFMNFGDVKLASSSPERFLEVKDRIVETRPIKGTNTSAESLKNSEKDRAENVMIVDLLRNDLSKVCEDHSIEVDKLCNIESFEGLYHMVSTVRGKLRGDMGPLEAFKACFPGGSITGAPKIRAMEIIEELEPNRRGAYCGTIGYIGFNGNMDTAITIRTLVYEKGKVHLQTGGGITAQSEPETELQETLTKAEKIFESFAPTAARKIA